MRFVISANHQTRRQLEQVLVAEWAESWNGSPRTEGLLGVVVCLDVQTLIHFTHVTTGPSGDSWTREPPWVVAFQV